MLKDVWISINSIHSWDAEDQDRLEFTTDGYYFYDGENGCLSYMESEVTGLEGTRTSVIVTPHQVVVDRDGLITSRMVFQEGVKDTFQFATPYGSANLGIDTRSIHRSLNDSGGQLEIDYVVDMEHAVSSRNKFQITIREMEPDAAANG